MHVGELIRGQDLEDWAARDERIEALIPWAELIAEVRAGLPGDWVDQAACKGESTDAFFVAKGHSTKAARALCDRCEVRAECRDWANELGPEQVGIAAGLTDRQRAALRSPEPVRVELAPAASRAAPCGACGRLVADRMKTGYCGACYAAWRRAGRPDRSEFEADRVA